MAVRRGLGNQERLAIDSTHASASVTLVSAPCFLYGVVVSKTDTNATGLATLNDVSASGDVAADINKTLRVKLSAGGVSAEGESAINIPFDPPIFIAKTLAVAITNAEVTVRYLAAS